MSSARIHPLGEAATTRPAEGRAGISRELLDATRRRLIAFVSLIAVGSVVYILLGGVAFLGWGSPGPGDTQLLLYRVLSTLITLVLAALIIVFARRAKDAPRLERLAIIYLLSATALGAFGRYDMVARLNVGLGWTGIAVVVVLLPVLVPLSPRRALLTGLAAVGIELGGYGLVGYVRGAAPELSEYVLLFRGDFIAAGVAYAVAWIVDDLRLRLYSARKLGSYALIERIGVGGMGEVWRARHGSLARPAAIKLIKPSSLERLGERGQAMMVARFKREAQATALLECPHTIDVYDFGVATDGTLYYAMEMLDGVDLHDLISLEGRMPPERVVYLLLQACESLAEAHARGLIHRDIKPSNLFLCRYGGRYDFIKVLDFGLVKVLDTGDEAQAQLTGEGVTGTPAFLPPEQGIKGREIDARSDIYALACVAYWLLTAQLVFTAGSAAEFVTQHVQAVPLAPGERLGLSFPPALEELIMRSLAKDPDERPQSVEEFAAALKQSGLAQRWDQAQAERSWNARVGSAHTHQTSAPAEPVQVPATQLL